MGPLAPPRGTKDLLPDEAPAWRWLHEKHATLAGRFGYQLIDTPVFESTELFARGVGSGTDIVDKEMYTFSDHKGRSLTLRPEGTAPVVRAVLGAHLDHRSRPVRVHYAMAMFRYDRPQDLRRRQFAQVGVECIGERDPCYDAEVIELGWRFMAELRIDGVVLQINSLGDRDDRLSYRDALRAYYTPLRDSPLRALSLAVACRRSEGARGDAAPSATSTASTPASPAARSPAPPAADSSGSGSMARRPPPPPPTDPLSSRADQARIQGSASATVWVVEVSDFQCPFCRNWHE